MLTPLRSLGGGETPDLLDDRAFMWGTTYETTCDLMGCMN